MLLFIFLGIFSVSLQFRFSAAYSCARSPGIQSLTCNLTENVDSCEWDLGACCNGVGGQENCGDPEAEAFAWYEVEVAILSGLDSAMAPSQVEAMVESANMVLRREVGVQLVANISTVSPLDLESLSDAEVIAQFGEMAKGFNLILANDAGPVTTTLCSGNEATGSFANPGYARVKYSQGDDGENLFQFLRTVGFVLGAGATGSGCPDAQPSVPVGVSSYERGAGLSIMRIESCENKTMDERPKMDTSAGDELQLFFHSTSLLSIRINLAMATECVTTLPTHERPARSLLPTTPAGACEIASDTPFELFNANETLARARYFAWEQHDLATEEHGSDTDGQNSSLFLAPSFPTNTSSRMAVGLSRTDALPSSSQELQVAMVVREFTENVGQMWGSYAVSNPLTLRASAPPIRIVFPVSEFPIIQSAPVNIQLTGIVPESSPKPVDVYFRQSRQDDFLFVMRSLVSAQDVVESVTRLPDSLNLLELDDLEFQCNETYPDAQIKVVDAEQSDPGCDQVVSFQVLDFVVAPRCYIVDIDISETGEEQFFGIGNVTAAAKWDFFYEYTPLLSVQWNLIVQEGKRAHIIFESFDVDNSDVIGVYEGLVPVTSAKIESLTGSKLPDQIWSKGPKMAVTFQSDEVAESAGFRVRFTQADDKVEPLSPELIAVISIVALVAIASTMVVRNQVAKKGGKKASRKEKFLKDPELGDVPADAPSPEPANTLVRLSHNGAGFNVKFETLFFAQYFRNERKNLQCFPHCPFFGEYAFAKENGMQHKNGHLCASPIMVQIMAPKLVNHSDLIVLGFVAEHPSGGVTKKSKSKVAFNDDFVLGAAVPQSVVDSKVTGLAVTRGREQPGSFTATTRTFSIIPPSSLVSWDFKGRLKRNRPARGFAFHVVVLCRKSFLDTVAAITDGKPGALDATNQTSVGSVNRAGSDRRPRLLPSGSHDSGTGLHDPAALLGSGLDGSGLDMSWLDDAGGSLEDIQNTSFGEFGELGASLSDSSFVVVGRACSSPFDISTTKAMKKDNKSGKKRDRKAKDDGSQDEEEGARDRKREV